MRFPVFKIYFDVRFACVSSPALRIAHVSSYVLQASSSRKVKCRRHYELKYRTNAITHTFKCAQQILHRLSMLNHIHKLRDLRKERVVVQELVFFYDIATWTADM